jgi:hypothetical protein
VNIKVRVMVFKYERLIMNLAIIYVVTVSTPDSNIRLCYVEMLLVYYALRVTVTAQVTLRLGPSSSAYDPITCLDSVKQDGDLMKRRVFNYTRN